MTVSVNHAATLLNPALRALAPKLVSYQCELRTLIDAIEADSVCAQTLIRYADKRQNDPENTTGSVHQAVVYLGLIEVKQFLFAYLLLHRSGTQRQGQVQLLIRARLTAELFRTNGPLNKDLAFVGALISGRTQLGIDKPESIYLLFKLGMDSRNALRNYDYGLRDAIRQAAIIETKCHPKSSKREPMPEEFETLFQDALYWANTLLRTLQTLA